MNIVIVGAGKVGTGLCDALSREGHNIVLIENREERLSYMLEQYQIMGILGNGSLYSVQMEAQVDTCDVFISATPVDELNLIACVTAKKLGAKTTIARVRTPGFAEQANFLRDSLGISRLINPEIEAAQEIYRMVRYPSALSVEPFAYGRVNLVGLLVTEDSPLNNVRLADFRKKYKEIIVCIVIRGDETMIPDGNTVLQNEDRVFVTGKSEEIGQLYRSVGVVDKIKSFMMIGGGRITRYILDLLKVHKSVDVKVIEQSEKTVEELANEYPNVSVIKGDGTDHQLLENENIEGFDCVATLTGIDEENIILSMFASSKNVPRTITKINRTNLLPVLKGVGLQSIITPADISVTGVLRWIRAIGNSEGSKVEALYRLSGNRAEVLQFYASANSEIIDKPIRDLFIKSNTIIAAIIRGNQIIVPKGDDVFMAKDHVMVVTMDNEFDDLDDILE